MTYAYFKENGEVVEVGTIRDVVKNLGIEFKELTALGGSVRKLTELKLINASIDFNDALFKINRLETIMDTLFIHNPNLGILKEIEYANNLHDLIPEEKNKKDSYYISARRVYKPRSLFNSTPKKEFSFREITEDEAKDLINKNNKPLYTFIKSANAPFKINLKKATSKITNKFKDLTESDLYSVRDWLLIPNLTLKYNVDDALKELDKMEKYINGRLLSNPVLPLEKEVENIVNFNKHIENLIELSSKDSKFKKRLINLLLED